MLLHLWRWEHATKHITFSALSKRHFFTKIHQTATCTKIPNSQSAFLRLVRNRHVPTQNSLYLSLQPLKNRNHRLYQHKRNIEPLTSGDFAFAGLSFCACVCAISISVNNLNLYSSWFCYVPLAAACECRLKCVCQAVVDI